MKHFIDQVLNGAGSPISGATVAVRVANVVPGTGALASIFSDDGVTAKANPVTTDGTGTFDFYVADGRYDFVVTAGTSTKTVADLEIADQTESQAGDATAKFGTVNAVNGFLVNSAAPANTVLRSSGTAFVSGAVNLATDTIGALPLGSIGSPTGTGFAHTTAGAWDAASKLVNLTSATDVAPNQGSSVTVLHGNVAGQALFASITPSDAGANVTGSGNFVLATGATIASPSISSPAISSAGLTIAGATSGLIGVVATPIANNTTLTLPNGADTLIGKATTDVLTNKTLDTAGAGNVLKINGTQVSAVTGTGSVVLATSPVLTTPNIGVATGTSLATTGNISALTAGVGTTIHGGAADVTFNAVTGGTVDLVVANTAGAFTLNLPLATDTLVGKATTDSLTNKTLVTPVIQNTGTTTTVLHGNAAGNASFAGVSLTADTSANQGTTTTVLHGNAAGQPSFAAVSLTADVTGSLPIGSVTAPTGTGFAHITTGAFDAASKLVNLTATTDVAANQGTTTTLLHGNAAGQPSWTGVSLTADATANQGSTTTVLHGNAAGQPSFGAVVLTTDVSGVLPTANGGTGQNSTATFPTSGVVVTEAATETLTNKRVTPRQVSMADATSVTPTSDTADINTFTSTQAAGTLTVNAPSGTPTDGQKLVLRLKSTNAQTYSFNATYAFSTTVTAPTTLAAGKTDYIGLMWNATNTKWDAVAVDQGH